MSRVLCGTGVAALAVIGAAVAISVWLFLGAETGPRADGNDGALLTVRPPLSKVEIAMPRDARTVQQVVDAISSQSGNRLRISRTTATRFGNQNIQLNPLKLGFWQAVAATSMGSGLGLAPLGDGFLLTPDEPAITRWSLVGPGLLAMDWPVVLERNGVQSVDSGVAARLYFDPWEMDRLNIRKAKCRTGRDAKPVQMGFLLSDKGSDYLEWVASLKGTDANQVSIVSGELTCEVRHRFVEIAVRTDQRENAQKGDISAALTGSRRRKDANPKFRRGFGFLVTWKTGLTKEELLRYREDQKRTIRGADLSDKEREWLTKAFARCRHLRVIRVQAVDSRGDVIAPFMFTVEDNAPGEMLVGAFGEMDRMNRATVRFVFADVNDRAIPFEIGR